MRRWQLPVECISSGKNSDSFGCHFLPLASIAGREMGVPFADVGACHPGAAHHANSENSEWGANSVRGELSLLLEERVDFGGAIINRHEFFYHSRIVRGSVARATAGKRYTFRHRLFTNGLIECNSRLSKL